MNENNIMLGPEEWRNIGGLDGYQVSSYGHLKRPSGKITCGAKGTVYTRVTINKRLVSMHRLVGEAFLSNPKNLPQVNHKNGIKVDNRVCNLEWVTCSENAQHAYDAGLRVPPKGRNTHGDPRPVKCVETGKIFSSISAASKSVLKGSAGNIQKAIKRNGTAYGYKWEYINEKILAK